MHDIRNINFMMFEGMENVLRGLCGRPLVEDGPNFQKHMSYTFGKEGEERFQFPVKNEPKANEVVAKNEWLAGQVCGKGFLEGSNLFRSMGIGI
jgi:hypothetical protein